MRVNGEHESFKHNGETNYAYQTGQLQAYLEGLAERVESEVYDAEEYVEELKNKGILED
jgi:hypothetical protein